MSLTVSRISVMIKARPQNYMEKQVDYPIVAVIMGSGLMLICIIICCLGSSLWRNLKPKPKPNLRSVSVVTERGDTVVSEKTRCPNMTTWLIQSENCPHMLTSLYDKLLSIRRKSG